MFQKGWASCKMGRRYEELILSLLECKSRKHSNLTPLQFTEGIGRFPFVEVKHVFGWYFTSYIFLHAYAHLCVPILYSTIRIILHAHILHSEAQFLACALHLNWPVDLQNPIKFFWPKWQLKSLFSKLRQRLGGMFSLQKTTILRWKT